MTRQIAQLANRNIPYHGCHAPVRNEDWVGGRKLLGLPIFMGLNPLSFVSLNFLGGI